MSDGLTVPFALAAGLSGANVTTHVVVLAGLAEIAAGCIAMGLGGYLAARTDAEHYENEFRRETIEAREIPDEEAAEVARVFRGWGLSEEQIEPLVATIVSDHDRWVGFMMKFELGLDEPDPRRAPVSAATIGPSSGFPRVGLGDSGGAGCVRVRKGTIHGNSSLEGRFSNGFYRGAGGDGGVPDCEIVSVRVAADLL
jgi:hypothetical protein